MNDQTLSELIVFVLGIFLTFFGYSKLKKRKYLVQNGIKTEGTIVRFTVYRGMKTPVVNYETKENESITKEYSTGSNFSPYKPGDSIPIIYDPIKHDKFIIDNKWTKRFGFIAITVGIVIVIYSIIIYFLKIPMHS